MHTVRDGMGTVNDLLPSLMALTKHDTLIFLHEAPGGSAQWRNSSRKLPWKTEIFRSVPFDKDRFYDAAIGRCVPVAMLRVVGPHITWGVAALISVAHLKRQ